MLEKKESGYRLREKRVNQKGDVSKWARRLLSYYLLLNLRDFQFLQLGFADDTVIPTAGGVVFCEHVVQFANVADGAGLRRCFLGEAIGKNVGACAEASEVVVMAFEVVDAFAGLEDIV